jgi:hypothetical protein
MLSIAFLKPLRYNEPVKGGKQMPQVKCEYCGAFIEETAEKCPNCGAVNNNFKRIVDDTPKTIDELKDWYMARKLPPESVTRFFIGKDIKEARAFGIYKDGSNYIVYKNKNDGSRAVRYKGTDEAYAVNEIYQKMKAELLERKEADINNGRQTSGGAPVNPSPKKKGKSALAIGCLTVIIIFIAHFLVFGLLFLTTLGNNKTPDKGYYDYDGDAYYYAGGAWYTPGDDGEWERNYHVPDQLEKNYSDYYEARSYDALDEDFAEDFVEYTTEERSYDDDYNYNYYDDDDSWNDSNWDDDDWDYDYDSYDSYDSDWDSDW